MRWGCWRGCSSTGQASHAELVTMASLTHSAPVLSALNLACVGMKAGGGELMACRWQLAGARSAKCESRKSFRKRASSPLRSDTDLTGGKGGGLMSCQERPLWRPTSRWGLAAVLHWAPVCQHLKVAVEYLQRWSLNRQQRCPPPRSRFAARSTFTAPAVRRAGYPAPLAHR